MTDPVILSIRDSVASVTLNRPEKRNALNAAIISDLKSALVTTSQDANVRCAVIKGAGSDFCSGADLESLRKISEASVEENFEDARSLLELFVLIRQVPIPVIAAVHGRALAGGCGLASACDLVLAAATARFGYPEVKIGFVPAMVLAILRRSVSEKRAFELLTLGKEFSAVQAKEIGLVNAVFAEEDFSAEVTKYAEGFKVASRSAVALTKSLLYGVDGMSLQEALDMGADVNVIARLSDDCKSGVARFLNRS